MQRLRWLSILIVGISLGTLVALAQQMASPRGTAEFSFADGKKISISYGRPYVRGRKIMGGLVPYGEEWRTGANEATSFVTQADLDVAGTKVPAGSYTLFTLPSEGDWKLIISKKTGEWGIPYPGAQFDLARIPMKKQALSQSVEQLTISFEKQGASAGRMNIDWEKTRVAVDFSEAKK